MTPGGSLLKGTLGGSFGVFGGLGATFGRPRESLGEHFWRTGGRAKSFDLIYKIVHCAFQGQTWGILGGNSRQRRAAKK